MPERPISRPQLKRLQTLWGLYAGHPEASGSLAVPVPKPRDQEHWREQRLDWLSSLFHRPIGSASQLTRAEAIRAIDELQKALPPGLVRPPKPGGRQSRLAQALEKLADLRATLGWSEEQYQAFLRSRTSPIRGRLPETLDDLNALLWGMKSLLRRKEKSQSAAAQDRPDDSPRL